MPEAKPRLSEDWLAVLGGLLIFALSLGVLAGVDLLGWGVKTQVWMQLANALAPVSKTYGTLPGALSLLATYFFLLLATSLGARALRLPSGEFVRGFTAIFWISYACWIAGSYAYIAATPDKQKSLGILWSLNLTSEAGFVIALVAGLVVGNFFPRFGESIRTAIRPEWYIKTAIVLLGGILGVAAVEQWGLAKAVMFRGLCAIVEAYLIYWALVYFVARKFFKFSREWAVPLASGISICGVSAAIATGAAIRARPVVPIMVSSLVVIFAVVELLVLPFAAQHFLYQEPMVAGAWMGLAVKTDGAAVAAGAMADSLIRAKAQAVDGVSYQQDWIMGTATTVKVFIDIFIGVWAFILAAVWCTKIEARPGDNVRLGEILGAVSQVRAGLSAHVSRGLAHRRVRTRLEGKSQDGHGRSQCLPRHFLCHDVLFDRRGVEFQEAVGRGDWPLGRRLSGLPVRVRDLDWAGDLLAVLSRRKTAPGRRLIWRNHPRLSTS